MPSTLDIADLARAIPRLELGRESTLRPLLADVKTALGVRNAALYRPVPREAHWDVSICEWVGAAWEERQEAYARYIRRFPSDATDFAVYDPFAVEHTQRNRVMSQGDLAALDPRNDRTHARVLAAVGVAGDHQLRVLVCDGPKLLAWLGVLQAEPFRPDQVAALQTLVEPLQRRLSALDALLPEGLGGALLESLFAQMSQAVFVLRRDGRVQLANRAGEELLTCAKGRAELGTLRKSMHAGADACPGYRATVLRAPGLPDHLLAIRDQEALPTAVSMARAIERWRLDPKLAFVLERLCTGASNKEVAQALGCAEVTVERHITRLFRASGTRSRTELVAKVHRL